MKTFLLPLASAGLLLFTACSTSTTSDTAASGTTDAASSSTMSSDSSAGKMGSAMAADSGSAMSGTMAGNGAADPNGPTAPHANDAEFMQSAAHSDQNEMQLSKLALSKGVSGKVKAYANQMIADHTKSTANLKPIAAKAGVTLPTDMDADHQAMLPAMQKLSGKEFETKYVQQMVADHQKTANTLKAHQTMTKNAALQNWITTTLPVVEGHLSMAQQDSKTMTM
ncbi:DUF4142 domain-containing protein [Hymenobacter sp. RP-2-7]|uniref:DUF4142 domain-containing protein n=1 Tax=Hymenobacter polaris TaxID=2682546 RepID=A0A7Y0AGM1_9BACT|nr:DUF4142 domain-containing protein [Hymenobacter polaris]NML66967.1 DUF4142 domain-containing protein [Hymenobacter polaris]